MKDILQGKRLILGSKSPRRNQLLKEMDLPFEQKFADADESFPADMPVMEVAEHIARKKADALIDRLATEDILITSDSIVICEDIIYGKPKDLEEARAFIKVLSDNVHSVVTGVCITNGNKFRSFSERSEVKLSVISPDELEYYIEKYMPLDKAGGYGIQEWIGHAKIEWINGTYPNIMGLPTRLVYDELSGFIQELNDAEVS